MDPKTEARIRDRAYQLWQEAGAPHGQSDAYWYRAEQEVLAEQALSDTQISAEEEGPDRDAERLSGDGVTAGEAGPGYPQRPGEKLQASAPITAPKRAAKPAAPKPAAAKPAAAKASAEKAAPGKPAAAKTPVGAAPKATSAKPSPGATKARKSGPTANGTS